ncbi:MAG: hypothetical protein TE42_09735 [Candidatus Synechococcus spongiarum SP3]|uniref:Uncharacterized protein n=1 Tax=Candidatus Synechococcus spongiarum SP3 TaxID=1604020 RepID=A0A0G2IVJ2_9SYNE|nr:MAG: hypothetical protein TE42_09735 [Candidatus Synechococcus spongiarum SP3]
MMTSVLQSSTRLTPRDLGKKGMASAVGAWRESQDRETPTALQHGGTGEGTLWPGAEMPMAAPLHRSQ